MSTNKIKEAIRSTYFPLLYSSTIFLDQKAGEILATFVTLEELLSPPVSASGVHLLQSLQSPSLDKKTRESQSNSSLPMECSKAVIMTCEERPGTVKLIERIKKTLQSVEAITLWTNWTEEDAISYERILLDSFSEPKSFVTSSLGILDNLEKEPYERTINELKVYYRTTQVDISYVSFLGVACPLDNLFITASKDSDQWKLLIDQECSQVEGISQLSEPLRSILASIARNIASFYSVTRLRPTKLFSLGPLSKLVVEQFQRCSARANEEMKESLLSQNMSEERDSYLLMVDRACILSEAFHMNESLLDRIFSFYPRRTLDVVSSFSNSFATQLGKLNHQVAKIGNETSHLYSCSQEELEQLYRLCMYGENGQGLVAECRLDREDSHLAKELLMSLVSIDTAEQNISIIRELLVHILQDNDSGDYGSCSLEDLLQNMKETKTRDGKPLSEVYRLVWEMAMVAYTVLESSPLARLWNELKRLMDTIMQSENKNSWIQSSSNLLLSLLDGIQSIVDISLSNSAQTAQSIPTIDMFQSILLLITWVYLTPVFRKLETTEEDILIDTLAHLMDKECENGLECLLCNGIEEWKDIPLWELSHTFIRMNHRKLRRSQEEEQDRELDSSSRLIRRLLSGLASISDMIRSYWREEGETMTLLFRRMISQFPQFRMPSLVHSIGKLKDIREEESFGLKLEYIPSQYLGERLLSGLQRLRTRPFVSGTLQQRTLVVFVVGGIRFSELATVEDFVKEFFSDEFDEVLFGSTHLTNAFEMLYLTLLQCVSHPKD
ncbi:hypothetical protein GpartN1_g7342.t1 [Galdieria partita]|uniref:Sec1 family domain-containing protein 2 n=1 Tax=Galdieria partita TaxID=83374 RepID=A0A9C7UU24_9RHOD|nr:hypothetical protein GpartN1_g7342.t1 [Galdieria partita]